MSSWPVLLNFVCSLGGLLSYYGSRLYERLVMLEIHYCFTCSDIYAHNSVGA
jgi:hypothetical protein